MDTERTQQIAHKVKANTLASEAREIRRFENAENVRAFRLLRKLRPELYLSDVAKRAFRFNKKSGTGQPFTVEAKLTDYLAEHRKTRDSLAAHRRFVVRPHARTTHLARMALKGLAYFRIESKCALQPDWSAVEKEAIRFGGDPRAIKEWIETSQKNRVRTVDGAWNNDLLGTMKPPVKVVEPAELVAR